MDALKAHWWLFKFWYFKDNCWTLKHWFHEVSLKEDFANPQCIIKASEHLMGTFTKFPLSFSYAIYTDKHTYAKSSHLFERGCLHSVNKWTNHSASKYLTQVPIEDIFLSDSTGHIGHSGFSKNHHMDMKWGEISEMGYKFLTEVLYLPLPCRHFCLFCWLCPCWG